MAAVDTADAPGVPAPQEKAPAPVRTPYTAPPGTKVLPRIPLTADEKPKLEWLTERARAFTEVKVESPKAKVGSGPLTDDERMWMTRECLIRYLRATRWDEKESEKRLMQSLAWRREFGVAELTAEHISHENETGKPSPKQVEHLVYMMERVIELMPPGQECLALLINFKQGKGRKNTAPGIGMAREVLNILQMHYPERLGRALIVNGTSPPTLTPPFTPSGNPLSNALTSSGCTVPWVVWGFFKLITPFIDPRTVEKLKFNEDMTKHVDPAQLWPEFQPEGKMDFEYDHAQYWPALEKLCDSIRAERKRRWVEGGKHVGELEDYITGGLEVGIGGENGAKGPEPEDLKVGELDIKDKEGEKDAEAKASA